MAYEHLTIEQRQGVAWITIDRATQFNALNLPAMRELCDLANRCGSDPTVRAIVLTGSGDKAFCAGGDVAAFAAAIAAGDPAISLLIKEMTGYFHLALSRFAWMDAPVIAAVNGVAAGAGLSLAAACDLAVAADGATFTSAYTKIGMTPDGSATYFVTRLVGARRASELFLTNRVLSAAEALDWGLVNRVVPASRLRDEVEALAVALAAGPTRAHGGVKRLVQTGATDTLESQMEREARSIVAMAGTADGREGIQAFVERRKPRFTGA